ncbi:MAG: Ig domain-containing protein, partial [Nitrospira sp.]|nr:Ig domain-containing protein [Nitrospira sp.]
MTTVGEAKSAAGRGAGRTLKAVSLAVSLAILVVVCGCDGGGGGTGGGGSIVIPPILEVTTVGLSTGVVGVAYSETVQATGGQPPYTWAIVAGALPAGLNFNTTTGEITGTPATAGSSSVEFEVADSGSLTRSKAFTLNVLGVMITTTSLPNSWVGATYSSSLQLSGGLAPYSWSVASGSLPPGLILDSGTGVVSGSPTTSGSYTFVVSVTDASTNVDSQTYNIDVTGVVITTISLPNGTQGIAYSTTLVAANGLTPYSWAVTAGTLPLGLALNASTGVIDGTPLMAGTNQFTIEVSDAGTGTDSKVFNLNVAAGSLDLWVSPPNLNGGAGVPSPARAHHTAVWTNSRMIVWGGQTGSLSAVRTGKVYDPLT